MKKGNKTDLVKIRVTEEEKKLLKEKAKNYQSLSSYMLAAAKKFDDRRGAMLVDYLDSVTAVYLDHKSTINKTASNINQLAHYANLLRNQGICKEGVMAETAAALKEWNDILKELLEMNAKIEKRILKL